MFALTYLKPHKISPPTVADEFMEYLMPAHIKKSTSLAEFKGYSARESSQLAKAIDLHQKGSFKKASLIYQSLLKNNSKHFDALHLLGVIAFQNNDLQVAVNLISKALSIAPNDVRANYNLGVIFQELKQLNAAVACYDIAIQFNSQYAEAYSNRGAALKELRQYEASLNSYDNAIKINPASAEDHTSRGICLQLLLQPSHALNSFEYAARLNPQLDYLFGLLLSTRMQLCDWTGLELSVAELVRKIQGNVKASAPFSVLSVTGSLLLQHKASEIYSQDKHPAAAKPMWSGQRYGHKKIR